MSRQDKSVSERHTKTLRELVKKPENKVCADCKRNDPRWASWNLGVFLCIRCSGIHRGMGTHVSKVKSVDLDVWTPEQMDSIQKWGNTRANLYWEAHLKPGHIPADHKMESFIRSKYESRRWALEGPPPKDPSILESNHEEYSEPTPPSPALTQATSVRQTHAAASGPRQSHAFSSHTQSKSRAPAQIQSHSPTIALPNAPPLISAPQDDLFSLDFHAPTSSAHQESSGVQKDVKNDILSLFASTPPRTGIGGGGGFGIAHHPMPAQPTSITGSTSSSVWSAQAGWNGSITEQSTQHAIWGQQHHPQHLGSFMGTSAQRQKSGLIEAQSAWGGGAASPVGDATTASTIFSAPFSNAVAPQPGKKDDTFGDLWGGFK